MSIIIICSEVRFGERTRRRRFDRARDKYYYIIIVHVRAVAVVVVDELSYFTTFLCMMYLRVVFFRQ